MDVTQMERDDFSSELEIDPEEFNNAVRDHAKYLGIDPINDSQFLYIAQEALLAPLPDDWDILSEDNDGDKSYYYYNKKTNVKTDTNPLDQHYRKLFINAKKEQYPSWEYENNIETFQTENPLFQSSSHVSEDQEEEEAFIFSTSFCEDDENDVEMKISGHRIVILGHRNAIKFTEYYVNNAWLAYATLLVEFNNVDKVNEYNHKNHIKINKENELRGNDYYKRLISKSDEKENEKNELIKTLRQRVKAISEELLEFQQVITENEEKIKSLEAENKRFEGNVADLKMTRDENELLKEELEGNKNQLSEKTTQYDQKLAKFSSKLSEIQKEIIEKEESNLNLSQEREELKEKSEHLERAVKRYETENKAILERNKKLNEQLEEVLDEVSLLKQTIREYQENEGFNKRILEEKETLKSLVQEYQVKLKHFQEQVNDFKQEKAELTSNMEISEGLLKEEKQLVKELEMGNQEKEKEVNQLKEVLKTIEEEKQQVLKQLSSLDKLDIERKAFKAHNVALEEKLSEVEVRNSELTEEISRLEQELKKVLKTPTPVLKNEEQEAEIKNLRNRLSRVEKETEIALVARTKQLELLRRQDNDNYEKELKKQNEKTQDQMMSLKQLLEEETKKRRKLNNKIIDLQGNIRVFCRIRPSLEGFESCIEEGDMKGTLCLKNDEESFEFHEVFNANSKQQQVYQEVKPLIQSYIDGFDVCIFAYGQTGSGKTHTIEGNDSEPGILRQSLKQIFSETYHTESYLEMTMIEVYNEQIRDLFSKKQENLEIKLNEEGKQVVKGLMKVRIDEMSDKKSIWKCLEVLKKGWKERTKGSHNLNEHSSRSHLVVTFELKNGVRSSKLFLIDLAGSERLDRTGATGNTLVEAKFINKSLSALGNVIQALLKHQQKKHVPYRDSKLTHLLKDSLSANSGAKVVMFVCVAPEEIHLKESLCSLNFGKRCMKVKLGKAKRDNEEVTKLRNRIIDLTKELKQLRK